MASRKGAPITKFHSNTNQTPPLPPPSSSRTCMCSPTKHPGSFRCSMHKKPPRAEARPLPRSPSSSNHHHHSMAFKAISLKAIILLQRIKRSSHDLYRRKTFQPKPTRFSLMNGTTTDAVAVS